MENDDILDAIEQEMLDAQKEREEVQKPKKVKSSNIVGAEEDKEIFVAKSSPDVSTSYKDRLEQVYEELTHLDKQDLEAQLTQIKEELKKIIDELEANEVNIRKNVVNKIDEMLEEREPRYIKETKPVVVKSAKEPIFNITNTLLMVLIATIVAVGFIAIVGFCR